jgi:hypothetical protein
MGRSIVGEEITFGYAPRHFDVSEPIAMLTIRPGRAHAEVQPFTAHSFASYNCGLTARIAFWQPPVTSLPARRSQWRETRGDNFLAEGG